MLCVAVVLCCLSCARSANEAYWPTREWKSISPAQAGMDAKGLEPLHSLRRTLPDATSVLALRHGLIVFEQYFIGDQWTLRNLREMTKGVVSTLVGVAIDQGLIDSVDQKLVDFFPENALLGSDPLMRQVSLRHLLTMSDGLRASGNTVQYTFTSPILSLPLKRSPGEGFEDNFMSAQILSMILTRSSGKSAHELAKQYLFEPLSIGESLWADFKGQEGVSHGADGLLLTTRDMAKIGYLLLRRGAWEGKQLVPAEWIGVSTTGQIQTGRASGYFGQQGFLWWVHAFAGHPGYFAVGTGGQVLCVVPDLDLVAVLTSKGENPEREEGESLRVIERHIIGSVTERKE